MSVYLIHFDKPIGDLDNPRGRAQHYLGCTDNLEVRVKAHRSGNGAKIMAAVVEKGIGFRLVRIWEGGRELEKQLKRQHNHPRFCPICKGGRHESNPGP